MQHQRSLHTLNIGCLRQRAHHKTLDRLQISRGDGPARILVTLGYAGWGPGQLEDEIGRNGWLSVAANTGLMFDLPYEARLTAAMGMLGLNYGNLSDTAGHA